MSCGCTMIPLPARCFRIWSSLGSTAFNFVRSTEPISSAKWPACLARAKDSSVNWQGMFMPGMARAGRRARPLAGRFHSSYGVFEQTNKISQNPPTPRADLASPRASTRGERKKAITTAKSRVTAPWLSGTPSGTRTARHDRRPRRTTPRTAASRSQTRSN